MCYKMSLHARHGRAAKSQCKNPAFYIWIAAVSKRKLFTFFWLLWISYYISKNNSWCYLMLHVTLDMVVLILFVPSLMSIGIATHNLKNTNKWLASNLFNWLQILREFPIFHVFADSTLCRKNATQCVSTSPDFLENKAHSICSMQAYFWCYVTSFHFFSTLMEQQSS